jgi:hypothetical protein
MDAKAREMVEHFEGAHHHAAHAGDEPPPHLMRNAAVVVAVLAVFLAIATFMGEAAMKEVITGETKAADVSAKLEANVIKTTMAENDATILRAVAGDGQGTAATDHATRLERRLVEHYGPVDEELNREIAAEERARDHAEQRHKLFEFASVGIQIAIVLASISIITRRSWLLKGGGALGVVGVGVLAAGFLA